MGEGDLGSPSLWGALLRLRLMILLLKTDLAPCSSSE